MKFKKRILLGLLIIPMLFLGACGNNSTSGGKGKVGKIMFADAQWSSIEIHNWIARTILEKGYGYKTGVKTGSTAATFTAFRQGGIDVYMEIWPNNIEKVYQSAIKSGDIKIVSKNYQNAPQGLYVPTYMIKGDPKRGIKAVAPGLKSVKDLPKYKKLFKDPSNPSKGQIIGSPTGWKADTILQKQMKAFGLNKTFDYTSPGSQSALFASLAKAYKAGKPWVGYGWQPTWVMGKYNMTLLKAPKYTKKCWNTTMACAFPNEKVLVGVNSAFAKKAPKVVKFLKNYKTSIQSTDAALKYMQNHKAKPKQAAIWWLKNNTQTWTKWVPSNVAKKVKKAI